MTNEYEAFYAEYNSKYTELSAKKDEIVRFEFSKGGNVFFRGLYTTFLSFKYGLFTNSKGKMVNKANDFTFSYGFDSNERLIYVLRNLDGIYTEEFLLYCPDRTIGITYTQTDKQLTDIVICRYNNNAIVTVDHAHKINLFSGSSFQYTKEIYRYLGSALVGMEEITGDTMYPKSYHTEYEVTDNKFKLMKQWIN